mmetsp:Transcript_5942/g.15125  ORF Transcript_5942/g.15125 Transcript_5942/m.15125 type:complete len:206 (-) Transcript_5942:442-1059(-)
MKATNRRFARRSVGIECVEGGGHVADGAGRRVEMGVSRHARMHRAATRQAEGKGSEGKGSGKGQRIATLPEGDGRDPRGVRPVAATRPSCWGRCARRHSLGRRAAMLHTAVAPAAMGGGGSASCCWPSPPPACRARPNPVWAAAEELPEDHVVVGLANRVAEPKVLGEKGRKLGRRLINSKLVRVQSLDRNHMVKELLPKPAALA